MELPPGFRFHPTDEELITHYLCKKVHDSNFRAIAVGEADLNKSEPWDLPKNAKMGENEWYVFCLRDKKYPTGLRTNRATRSGYWKATGKDKEIRRGKFLVGMKKTLVFYRGRAPKGMKSNWVMHEFRLEGNLSLQNLPQSAKTEWVISRVVEKCYGVKKPLLSNSDRFGQGQVPCFSNQDALVNSFNTTSLASLMNQNYQNSNGVRGQHDIDHAGLLSHLLRKTQQFKTDVVAPPNPDPDPGPSVATGPVDLQCLWNY